MKRKIFTLLLIPLFMLSITSCNKNPINETSSTITENEGSSTSLIHYATDDFKYPNPNNSNGYKVIYDCNNGFEYESTTDTSNMVLEPEKYPSKVAATFTGWYSDESCTNVFDFYKPVYKDTTIYAGYDIDYMELTNTISNKSLLSAVKVEGIFYNSSLSGSTAISTGSGVIIGANEDTYYCLTNHHVISKPSTYEYSEYHAIDCYGTKYTAYILYSDVNYDLALIMFTKTTTTTYKNNITYINFSNKLPKVGESVVTVGNPYRVNNSITYGKYNSLKLFVANSSIKQDSNVNFKVISHSGEIYDGSSGSMLLDNNLRLIGINFATQNSSSNEFMNSCAIPLDKIKEFINNYSNSIK